MARQDKIKGKQYCYKRGDLIYFYNYYLFNLSILYEIKINKDKLIDYSPEPSQKKIKTLHNIRHN